MIVLPERPLTADELIALLPEFASLNRLQAHDRLQAYLSKGRIAANADGTFDPGQVYREWARDEKTSPKSEADLMALIMRRIEPLDAQIDTMQAQLAPLIEQRDKLREFRKSFAEKEKVEEKPQDRSSAPLVAPLGAFVDRDKESDPKKPKPRT
jgi:hypothetical protein